MKYLLLILVSTSFFSFDEVTPTKPKKLRNLHIVDSNLHRSAQPNRKDMHDLEAMGVKTIINLRNVFQDTREIKGTSLVEVYIPMKAKEISYEDIVTTMCAIQSAEKPVLIHCLHGSDRTGCMVACYRMLTGMDKEEAIEEFLNAKYGYNKRLFPNILTLLKSIDPEKLKKDVNCNI